MGEMQDYFDKGARKATNFDEGVRKAKNMQRALDRQLDEWGRRAGENPVQVAATFVRSALYWRRVWRRRYRRLAGKAQKRIILSEDEHTRLVAFELQDSRRMNSLLYALWEYNLWQATFELMLDLGAEAKAKGEDPYGVAIGAFMFVQRRSYEILAGTTQPEWVSPRVRSGMAVVLTGAVAAQISLSHNRRLDNMLREEGDDASNRLLRELPAAVMYEWGNPPDSYSPFLQRVARLLEGEGSEQKRLKRNRKLASDTPTAIGGEDEDLAEFERQETLRQNLKRLESWVQVAGLSTSEAQIFKLDLETDFDTAGISQELGKSPSTVRQWRKRYLDKIRRAAGL